jgi:galactokinase
VDYSGYGVLPMALDRQDTIMAVRVVEGGVQEDTINLHNVSDRFPTRALTASSSIDVAHDWSRYVLAAYRGLEQAKDLVGTAPMFTAAATTTASSCVPWWSGQVTMAEAAKRSRHRKRSTSSPTEPCPL